jgi:excisionase family DNA binding protein
LEPQTYSVKEVAQLLGFAAPTVYRAIHEGKIPARRIGGRIVVLREEFDAFVKSSPKAREKF